MSEKRITTDDKKAYFFQSREELEEAARTISQRAEEKYQHSAYLYFIARFMVSLYESTISKIPIQVWNEYRSSIDHHMRYLTQVDQGNIKQIQRMEGHLQRAILDVCKLYTHRIIDGLEARVEKDSIEILRMVDSGRFYEALRTGIDDLNEVFATTKTHDCDLGNEREVDDSIVGKYLDVSFMAWQLTLIYRRARHDIEVSAATKTNIQAETTAVIRSEEEPLYKKMFEHIAGHAVYYGLAGGIGWLIGTIF
ncbi:MAG: hypothetical protein RPU73_15630 [Candidatus Sedimenticola sp. (ex Thyasira tokunagai)]